MTPIALDLGCGEFRSLRLSENGLSARRVAAVYSVLSDEPAHRRLLEQSLIPYSYADGHLVILGEAAFELASLIHVPVIPLLLDGHLPWDDPLGRQLVTTLIESVLPPRTTQPADGGKSEVENSTYVRLQTRLNHPESLCGLVLPGSLSRKKRERNLSRACARMSHVSHESAQTVVPQVDKRDSPSVDLAAQTLPAAGALIEEVLHLNGFTPRPVHPATALAWGELQDRAFTGVAVVIGAESIQVAITQQGAPIFEGTFARGFRSIEQRFALNRHRYLWDQKGNRYLDMQGVRDWVRNSEIDLRTPRTGDDLWLKKHYGQLLADAWGSMLPELYRLRKHPTLSKRIPILLSGGPTALAGTEELFAEVLERSCLPLRPAEFRISEHGPFGVARGVLVHTLMSSVETSAPVSPELSAA